MLMQARILNTCVTVDINAVEMSDSASMHCNDNLTLLMSAIRELREVDAESSSERMRDIYEQHEKQ